MWCQICLVLNSPPIQFDISKWESVMIVFGQKQSCLLIQFCGTNQKLVTYFACCTLVLLWEIPHDLFISGSFVGSVFVISLRSCQVHNWSHLHMIVVHWLCPCQFRPAGHVSSSHESSHKDGCLTSSKRTQLQGTQTRSCTHDWKQVRELSHLRVAWVYGYSNAEGLQSCTPCLFWSQSYIGCITCHDFIHNCLG